MLKVVARAALSPKHNVALIQVGEARFVLVGVSGDRLTPLCDINDSDQVADLAARRLGADRPEGLVFRAMLETQDSEFERAAEDVGDSLAADPRSLTDAKGQLGGLLNKLRSLRAAAAR